MLLLALLVASAAALPAPSGLWVASDWGKYGHDYLPNRGTAVGVPDLVPASPTLKPTLFSDGGLLFPDESTFLVAPVPSLLFAPTDNAYTIEGIAQAVAGTPPYYSRIFQVSDTNNPDPLLATKGQGLGCAAVPGYHGWTAGVANGDATISKAHQLASAPYCIEPDYHHYVMTVEVGTYPVVTLYIDGVLQMTVVVNSVVGGVAQITPTDTVYLSLGLMIKLKHVAFYPAAATQQEVNWLFSGVTCVAPPYLYTSVSCYNQPEGALCKNGAFTCEADGSWTGGCEQHHGGCDPHTLCFLDDFTRQLRCTECPEGDLGSGETVCLSIGKSCHEDSECYPRPPLACRHGRCAVIPQFVRP